MPLYKFLKNRKRSFGQSMVEFALVLPILIIFFVGTIEIGLIVNDYLALNRAVADACRYGSTLVGYSSAEVLIVGKLLDGLGENIKKPNLKIVSKTGTKYGPYTKGTTGTLLSGSTPVTTFAEYLFFRKFVTPDVFSTATTIAPTSFSASFVTISVEYQHDVIIPYASLIGSPQFAINSTNTWPINAIYPNQMSGFSLSGAMPVAVTENYCVLTGNPVTIKGDWLLAGGFGWLDLGVDYPSGGNNAGPNELAAWISNPDSAPNKITPPENVYSMTGQKNASGVRDALASLLGQEILVPIYDTTGGTGNNAYYHIIGFAVFRLNSVTDYPDINATYLRRVI